MLNLIHPRFLTIIFSITLVSSLGYLFYNKMKMTKHTIYKYQTVTSTEVQKIVKAVGVVKSENEVEVRAPIGGRIDKILVEEGQKVKKDQILFYLSSNERAALLDAARARGEKEFQAWSKIYHSTYVIAPINGTIIQRRFEPGQTFSADNPILVMSDRLTIKAKVDETDVGKIKVGNLAEITLDAYPNNKIIGRVDKIGFNAIVENGVTLYVVDILPETQPEFMRSGMTANVDIIFEKNKKIIMIPLSYLSDEEGQYSVYVETVNGQIEKRIVQVGTIQDSKIEIIKGINAGDVIVSQTHETHQVN